MKYEYYNRPQALLVSLIASAALLVFIAGAFIEERQVDTLVLWFFAAAVGSVFFFSRAKRRLEIDKASGTLRVLNAHTEEVILTSAWSETSEIVSSSSGKSLLFFRGSAAEDELPLLEVPQRSEARATALKLRLLAYMIPGLDQRNPALFRFLLKRGRFKPVLSSLIAMNVLIFLYSIFDTEFSFVSGALIKEDFFAGQYWRLFSYIFLHAGALHLFMNMSALAALGNYVETLLDQKDTFIVYVFSGLGAGLWALLWLAEDTPLVGASGAIFGLFGSICYLKVNAKRLDLIEEAVPTRSQLTTDLTLSFVISLLPFVSLAAHFGGFVVGFVSTAVCTRNHKLMNR